MYRSDAVARLGGIEAVVEHREPAYVYTEYAGAGSGGRPAWLTAGFDEEDIELREAELGTAGSGGLVPELVWLDVLEAERLLYRFGVTGIGRSMHWSGATVTKRYHVQSSRQGGIDVTDRVIAFYADVDRVAAAVPDDGGS
jgi:hypothetical protein